jgi:hypothetical protein
MERPRALPEGSLQANGTNVLDHGSCKSRSAVRHRRARHMNGIIYLVGLIVVIMFILSFLGLR